MKRTEYYNSQEELNNYYPDGIPSTVLAIVKGEEGKSVLFTTSNNESAGGTMEDQGGYNIDEDTQEKIEVSYEFATDTGASKTYVADYVSTYGGGEAPDMTAYVSKVELSNCGYVTSGDVSQMSYITMTDVSACGYVTGGDISQMGYITAQDVPAPDLSAYVSKTELEGMSYATESYVSSNFIEKQTNTEIENGTIYLKDDKYNNGGKISFYSGSNKYSPYLHINGHERGLNGLAARILAQGDLYIQNGASNGSIKMFAAYLFSNSAYTYIAGIGNYDGYDKTNAYSLQDVINEIKTTLGTAASVAEAIVGK